MGQADHATDQGCSVAHGDSVESLDASSVGRWKVTTVGSTHIWDIQPGRVLYRRLPGEASESFSADGAEVELTRVDRWPAVGSTSLIFFDDLEVPLLLEQWRRSSTIGSITRLDDALEGSAPDALGSRGHWLSTQCSACAPDGWVARDRECAHVSITAGSCDSCGLTRIARLEHSSVLLTKTHLAGTCAGEHCTIHDRSDHALRSFPQHWRSDRAIMERVCPHGVGHPDPDDCKLAGPDGYVESVHGCDGCCLGGVQ